MEDGKGGVNTKIADLMSTKRKIQENVHTTTKFQILLF